VRDSRLLPGARRAQVVASPGGGVPVPGAVCQAVDASPNAGSGARYAVLPFVTSDPLLDEGRLGHCKTDEGFLGRLRPLNEVPVGRFEQADAHHPVQLVYQRVPETVDIEKRNRFSVETELLPGCYLRKLLERAQPAG
jgi:hypothetical protein